MDNLNQDETLLARWLAGDLREADLEALRDLEGYPEYVEMLEALEGMSMPDFSPTLSWQQLKLKLEEIKAQSADDSGQLPVGSEQPAVEDEQSTGGEEQLVVTPAEATLPPITSHPSPVTTRIRRLIPWKMVAGIAAAVAFLVVAWWWVSGDENVFGPAPVAVTEVGEQKEVNLPDGSSVTLNALSSLNYSVEDWTAGRSVSLKGEAFFKAKKGKKFTVKTRQGTVEVVGTAFNVYARDTELEVKCTEGKVQVINPEGTERVLIKAGEQVSILNGRMQKRRGLEFHPKWFKGESTFRSAPLEKVFGEMERQYGVVVLADSLEGRIFSGKFVHKDLEKALKMVCIPMKLEYSVASDTVRVIH